MIPEKTYRAFRVTRHFPGHNIGARVSIEDLAHGTALTMGINSALGESDEAVLKLESLGIKVEAVAIVEYGDGLLLLTSDLKTPLCTQGGVK